MALYSNRKKTRTLGLYHPRRNICIASYSISIKQKSTVSLIEKTTPLCTNPKKARYFRSLSPVQLNASRMRALRDWTIKKIKEYNFFLSFYCDENQFNFHPHWLSVDLQNKKLYHHRLLRQFPLRICSTCTFTKKYTYSFKASLLIYFWKSKLYRQVLHQMLKT